MLYDEKEKKAHDSQLVRAQENLKLSHGGTSYSQPCRAWSILRLPVHVRATNI